MFYTDQKLPQNLCFVIFALFDGLFFVEESVLCTNFASCYFTANHTSTDKRLGFPASKFSSRFALLIL